MKAGVAIIMGVFLITATSLVSGVTTMTSEGDVDTLVATACAKCHDTNRICKNLGGKTLKDWDQTVSRMIKNGADVPSDKKDAVIKYLFSLEPESKPVCP